ncbi:uncharacterized protein Os04g0629400-like [Dioscorea cayenensis subsp. rotundata]|uniref:Uncharacterized protein Os04g0629400-like n=1 Tax=Dioscorea cayennensis subsp. rotundata TaxID=55577 RepID=A0AB40D7A2_DIOCR|nr:uncharacterized protein Os04g0629400-like [Dioscorea cayenensis subsp. rotundata]
MCYIGKATKIFFFIVAILAVSGLILGFGVLRRGASNKTHGCNDPQCRPTAVPFEPPPSSSSSSTFSPLIASPPTFFSPPNPIPFPVSPPVPYP